MHTNPVYLLLGSNVGNREEHLHHGLKKIEERAGPLKKISSFYETEPWGVTDQTDYLNAALLIETEFSPEELFQCLKNIEAEEGRTDQKKYAPRTLDIDILFYGDSVIQSEHLTIPHAKLHLRKFALIPMNEIGADFIHPVLQKTIRELLAVCEDKMNVRLFIPRQ